ncbi:zinc finger, C2H2 type, partial [Opisthorchis viverrini]
PTVVSTFLFSTVTDADEAYEGTPGDTLFDTVDVQGGINENTRPMASKSIEILTAHARSPGISSRPVEPIGQTLASSMPGLRKTISSSITSHGAPNISHRPSDYKDSSSLAEHMRQNHVDQSLPPKKSSKSQGYASEQTEHPCPKCGRHFKCWTGLKSHQRSVHPEGVRHVCEKCGLSFARELYLKRHIIQVHESEAKHTCPHCGKSVTRSWNLLKHIRNVHQRDLADEKSA